MASEILIDTSAWVAVLDTQDTDHAAAAETYSQVLRDSMYLVTTNLLVAETHVLIRKRAGHTAAIEFLARTKSRRLVTVYSTPDLEAQAAAILGRYADQDFSYADAVSFVVMRERGIREAFTFDHHFAVMGFDTLPRRRRAK